MSLGFRVKGLGFRQGSGMIFMVSISIQRVSGMKHS